MSREDLVPSEEKFVIASEIIRGRELLGMTQAQLSAASKVSLSAIKGYETGRNVPGAKELKLLCQALKISPNRMIFGVDEPFGASDSAASLDGSTDRKTQTDRERVKHLLQCLSSQECSAVLSLVHALAVARHGIEAVESLLEGADFVSGLDLVAETGEFDPYLHRMILKDPQVTKRVVEALRVATDQAQRNASVRREGGT